MIINHAVARCERGDSSRPLSILRRNGRADTRPPSRVGNEQTTIESGSSTVHAHCSTVQTTARVVPATT